MKPITIGHRGTIAQGPENTLSSFRKAIKYRIDMIELDARMTKDKEIVVMHDATVNRTTNGTGYVRNMSLRHLKKLRIGKKEKIPTLQEAISAIKGKCKINIHIKEHSAVKKIMEIIEKNEIIHNDIMVSSFGEKTLKKVKKMDPRIETGYLFRRPTPFYINVGKRLGVNCLHPLYAIITKRMIRKAHRNGFKVNIWPIKTERAVSVSKSYGADGLIIDDLRLIK